MTDKTHDGAAAIDRGYHWRRIDDNTPLGTKLQLVNKSAGVATYGRIYSRDPWWTHWAPLPTFEKEDDGA